VFSLVVLFQPATIGGILQKWVETRIS